MRSSQFPINTASKQINDTRLSAYQLLQHAGILTTVNTEFDCWLPLGARILQNLENLIRQEMDKIGALELKLMLQLESKAIITTQQKPVSQCQQVVNAIINTVKHYKQLPLSYYYIQDENTHTDPTKQSLARLSTKYLQSHSIYPDLHSAKHGQIQIDYAYRAIFKRLNLAVKPLSETSAADNQNSQADLVTATPNNQQTDYSNQDENQNHATDRIAAVHYQPLQALCRPQFHHNLIDQNGKALQPYLLNAELNLNQLLNSIIEFNRDQNTINWPASIAPFQLALLPINLHKSYRVRAAAEQLYQELLDANVSVIFTDNKIRTGIMFANIALIGIPHKLIIAERGLDQGILEYQCKQEKQNVAIDQALEFIREKIQSSA